MPTLITHAIAGAALGQVAAASWRRDWRFWCLAVLCSLLPDVDAIGFRFGIHYGDLWGHRGFTHSLFFAAIVSVAASMLLGSSWRERWKPAFLLFIITACHGILDALTNGGLGVAFLSPFDLHRYFLPWRPIRVSPIGAHSFLSERGIRVLRSEVYWVWAPGLFFAGLISVLRTFKNARRRASPAA